MGCYEQAMESLRITDPDFHQKLNETLEQITKLPEEIVQQLAASLDDVVDPGIYRVSLIFGLDNIRDAANESWEAFVKEDSWLLQHIHGAGERISTAVHGIDDLAAGTIRELHLSMNKDARLFSNLAMFNFLAAFFCFTAYFSYINNSSFRQSMTSSFVSKIFGIFLILLAIWVTVMEVNEDALRLVSPVMALGALVGRLPSFMPLPIKTWRGRRQPTEMPQTWSDTLGYTFGFLLSSGSFAWMGVMLQDSSRGTMSR